MMNPRGKTRTPVMVFTALLCATIGLMVGPGRAQETRLDDWNVDPIRGPVDLGLTDPALSDEWVVAHDASLLGSGFDPDVRSTLMYL